MQAKNERLLTLSFAFGCFFDVFWLFFPKIKKKNFLTTIEFRADLHPSLQMDGMNGWDGMDGWMGWDGMDGMGQTFIF